MASLHPYLHRVKNSLHYVCLRSKICVTDKYSYDLISFRKWMTFWSCVDSPMVRALTTNIIRGCQFLVPFPETGLGSVLRNPEPNLGSVLGNPEPGLRSVLGNPKPGLRSVLGNPEPSLGSVLGNPEPSLRSVLGNPEPGLRSVLGNPEPGLRSVLGNLEPRNLVWIPL